MRKVSRPLRPPTPDFDQIPVELKELRRWLCWRYSDRPNESGKLGKIPYNITDKKAHFTDPAEGLPFDSVVQQYHRGGYDGVGIVLGRGVCGLDEDNCVHEGRLSDDAERHVRLLDTVQAKYGFSPDTLKDELHRKAITGDDGERKGVAQLHHNITRWLQGEDLTGVDRTMIRAIQPILVFLDPAFTSPYLNIVYNDHFNSRDLRRQYRRVVTPLFSITVEDLENVLPYTHRHSLSNILESYCRANKNMHGSLSHSLVPLLHGATPGNDVVRARFNEFADRMELRFVAQTEEPRAEISISGEGIT